MCQSIFKYMLIIITIIICNTTTIRLPLTDRIILIETLTDQIIITTNKIGSIDNLRVKIDLIDLWNKKKISVLDLNGSLLLISRGFYNIIYL